MVEIELSNGMITLVDDEDYSSVSAHTWHYHRNKTYARVVTTNTEKSGKSVYISLHRFVMKAKRGQIVDHIDGNTLDNRKSNLRFANPCQNSCNAKPHGNRKFKGVTYAAGKYQAAIAYQNQDYYLGRYESAEAAARAYDAKAKELHGEFARLNFS